MAALLYADTVHQSPYFDRQYGLTEQEYQERLRRSKTVYVGNLSYFTKEEQIYEYFSLCGEVKRVIMGIDRYKKTPCGFCFVEYQEQEGARLSVDCLSRTRLEGRVIRVDWDVGFKEGRQFGRGRGGGQKRDSMRNGFDNERGGYMYVSEEKHDEDRHRKRRH